MEERNSTLVFRQQVCNTRIFLVNVQIVETRYDMRDICLAGIFRVFFIFLVLICKLWCFVDLAGWWQYLCFTFWDSRVPIFDYSGAISLVCTTHSFCPYIHLGISTFKYRCSLVSFIWFHCCHLFVVLLIDYSEFRELYFRCTLVCYRIYALISHHIIPINIYWQNTTCSKNLPTNIWTSEFIQNVSNYLTLSSIL
jgi:hypothetical protein